MLDTSRRVPRRKSVLTKLGLRDCHRQAMLIKALTLSTASGTPELIQIPTDRAGHSTLTGVLIGALRLNTSWTDITPSPRTAGNSPKRRRMLTTFPRKKMAHIFLAASFFLLINGSGSSSTLLLGLGNNHFTLD